MANIAAGTNDRSWVDAALKRLNCEIVEWDCGHAQPEILTGSPLVNRWKRAEKIGLLYGGGVWAT
jgi:hypothetical protein